MNAIRREDRSESRTDVNGRQHQVQEASRSSSNRAIVLSYQQRMTDFWLPVYSLALRELIRFFRQRTRVVGALGQPIIFWVLFGAGLHSSFRGPEGMSYQEYFFPGVAVMIVMFTAIFSTISIIEDRREGFLQGVLVAPIPRISLVLGKVIGGTLLAVFQAGLFLTIGPLLHLIGLAPQLETGVTWNNALSVVGFLMLLGFSLTSLGYMIAWPMESTHGFHAIMSVFLMPMWLLSGSSDSSASLHMGHATASEEVRNTAAKASNNVIDVRRII